MKLSTVNEKIINQKLALPIYSSNGIVLLNKGHKFTESSINNVKKHEINIIYLENDHMDVYPREIIEITLRLQLLEKLKQEFINAKNKKSLNDNLIFKIVNDLIKNINLSENTFLFNSISYFDKNIKLCNHSLDVAILSLKIGLIKKYDKKKLINLIYAALLHDIGKVIDENQHLEKGYEIVKLFKPSYPTIYTSILEHHEYEDGSGIYQKKGKDIYEFAKIINICNTYVNLMKEYLPNEAIEKMSAMAITKFDQNIYRIFLNNIYCYPNGLHVELSNGEQGVVVLQNIGAPTRPIIGIYKNNIPTLLNLTSINNLTVFIRKIIL